MSQTNQSNHRIKIAILLVTKYGRKKDAYSYNQQSFNVSKENFEVLPGTLLSFVEEKKDNFKSEHVFETLDCPDKILIITCSHDDYRYLQPIYVDLLRPIPTCRERLEVFYDEKWIAEGHKLSVGDRVFVKLKNELSEIEGILRYKGTEVPDSKGFMFGVQLMEKKGTCDGTIKKKKLFKTEQEFGVFVSLHKIRKRREDWHQKTRIKEDEEAEISGLHHCNLKVGERVVWISDEGPERGSVRWIGILPGELGDNITVGVEFDNAVGTGTGKYKDHRLFTTRAGHASLIPLIGLIKEEEFGPAFDASDVFKLKNSPESKNSANIHTNRMNVGQSFAETNSRNYDTHHYIPDQNRIVSTELISRQQDDINSSSKSTNSSSWSRNSNQEVDPDLVVGSMVEVQLKNPLYGVIRWIGEIEGKLTAGLEMEEELAFGTDGTFSSERYFTCAPKKAFFCRLYKCSKDKRFLTVNRIPSTDFGVPETLDIAGDIPPPEFYSISDFCGKNKGIQGHHNSCYLDATLFSMFYFTTVFDNIFNRPHRSDDLPEYPEVQRVLKEGIVNPLRKNHYVRADKVLKLRALLDRLGTIAGMMGEEKDPEEFLSALLTQIMKADPLLHLSSGEHTYFYQLFMEKDESLLLPTTQKLVELSFFQGNVKLKQIPSCLMIQMPRFGKDFKMFHRIVPSLQLDITDILENYPRDCFVCGDLATRECKDCYQMQGPGLNATAFCNKCVRKNHQHVSRRHHKPVAITVNEDFMGQYEEMKKEAEIRRGGGKDDITITIPRETMELFAVICIQRSHYVSFVKCGTGMDAPWVFFDSMADRMGEQGGYNIPEVTYINNLAESLDEKNLPQLINQKEDKDLPEHLRRILCDGYMCMYQNTDVAMFN